MDFEDEDPTEKLIEEVKAEVEAEAEAEWEAEERQEEAPEDPLLPDTFKETDPLDDLGETAPESPADERPVGELTVAEAVDAYMYKTPMRLLSSFFVFATLVNAVVELRGIRKKVASTGAFRRAILAGGIGFGAEVMRRAFQIVLDMDDEELNLPPWRRDLMDDIARKRDDIKRLAKEPVTFAFAYSLILAVSSKSASAPLSAVVAFLVLAAFRLGAEGLDFYEQIKDRPFDLPVRPHDLDLLGLLGCVPMDALLILTSAARVIRNPTNLRNVLFAVLLGNYGFEKWRTFLTKGLRL